MARYRDGAFGWGIVDPGHGLVFARAGRPLDAAAAAPLSGAVNEYEIVAAAKCDQWKSNSLGPAGSGATIMP